MSFFHLFYFIFILRVIKHYFNCYWSKNIEIIENKIDGGDKKNMYHEIQAKTILFYVFLFIYLTR